MTRILLRGLAAAGLAAGLSACATTIPDRVESPKTPTEGFQAKVVSEPEEIRLALHAQGISPQQGAALSRFVDGWREAEGGVIGIQAPRGGVDSAVAYRMSESARTFLVSQGVPEGQIEVVGYLANGTPNAPLMVGYLRYRAEIPQCGQAWASITRTMKNEVQPNFGCAVTANMAAQVANPADLLGPRDMDAPDAARRMTVLDKFRKGEVTSAAKDDQADGAISRAVE